MAGSDMHDQFKKLLKASHALHEGCNEMADAARSLHDAMLAFDHDYGSSASAVQADMERKEKLRRKSRRRSPKDRKEHR